MKPTRASVRKTPVSLRNCLVALIGSAVYCAGIWLGAGGGAIDSEVMKSTRLWLASDSADEGRRGEACGPALELLMLARRSDESVVTPCNMRNCDARVKMATRVPGGIVCRYLSICECT